MVRQNKVIEITKTKGKADKVRVLQVQPRKRIRKLGDIVIRKRRITPKTPRLRR